MTKKIKILTLSIILILLLWGSYFFIKKRTAGTSYEFAEAKISNLLQEVSVTGRVKPAQNINLSFEESGKVEDVLIKVGDKVKSGQRLVTLDSSELRTQILQAEANLEIQQANLKELEEGTRPEKIEVSRQKVLNAQKSVTDATLNLENVKNKAEADLKKVYDEALTAVVESVNVGTNAIFTITDIQYTHFADSSLESNQIAAKKETAVYTLLGGEGGGRWINSFISQLEGGAKRDVDKAQLDPTHEKIDVALVSVKSALGVIKTALEIIPVSNLTSTESTNLSTAKTNVNNEVITISNKQQGIETQKATNQSNISTYEGKLNEAKNALSLAEKELALEEAGATPEQITVQEAEVSRAEANLKYYQSQVTKTILLSPIDGIIIIQEAKKGEIVSSNQVIVSVMSVREFEIETNIPEFDIAKVRIGNRARVTLDAYGQDILFPSKVVKIDPAETMIEGVATYKVTLQFDPATPKLGVGVDREDERIKSGMTANVDILTQEKENVLVVPQRAIITKDGKKFVRIIEGNDIKEVGVETGIRDSDGNVEIVKGLKEGDKVVTFMK